VLTLQDKCIILCVLSESCHSLNKPLKLKRCGVNSDRERENT
jgi:hypothetical protein